MIPCFWIEPVLKARVYLRRYRSGDGCPMFGYHTVMNYLWDAPVTEDPEGYWRVEEEARVQAEMPHDDLRWPKFCGCGAEFAPEDHWQVFTERVYVRPDTGAEMTLRDLPVGAMYNAYWLPEHWQGSDGLSLHVQTPGGLWAIDSRASNCTMPDEWTHRCWIRHGIPPKLTVDKQGHTCAAGAGSIQCGTYHGFLVDGNLT